MTLRVGKLRVTRFCLLGALALMLLGLMRAPPAHAHAFLIRSNPEAGARLAERPNGLTLFFSEPFVRGSERISLRHYGGNRIDLQRPSSSGTVVHQPLPRRLKGIFVVHWRVLSDDGHPSVGEFAFAVGAGGALPALQGVSAPRPWRKALASWLLFAGLALALGGLVSELVVWGRVSELDRRLTRAPVGVGLALAGVASILWLVLLAGGRAGGAFVAGLDPTDVGRALVTRPGALTVGTLAALALAAASLRWRRELAFAPLLLAVVLTAVRGHAGTSGHWWAVVADSLHLAGAAIWAGALAHLMLLLARSDGTVSRSKLAAGAHGYARLAMLTVPLILLSGVVSALAEFGTVGDLIDEDYGTTLLVKSGFVGLALALALVARLRSEERRVGKECRL